MSSCPVLWAVVRIGMMCRSLDDNMQRRSQHPRSCALEIQWLECAHTCMYVHTHAHATTPRACSYPGDA